MQRVLSSALVIVLFAGSYPLGASTPGTPGPWSSDTFPTEGASAVAVTGHMKCVITEVRDDRVVQIWDDRSQKKHLVRITEEVPIKARKKKDFSGREKLEFGDLRAGHRVKLTYRTSDGLIIGVKVVDEVEMLQAAR